MLAHLLGIIGFLGPLIIWLIKKDQSKFIDDQGKESLNFQITMIFAWIAMGVVAIIPIVNLVGCLIIPVLFVVNIVFCIMGAMSASKGNAYRYPVAVRLLK